MRGLVFFDYDGTLADERERIFTPTEATKEAIKNLQSKGFGCVLATGRAKCYVPYTGIDFDGFVTSNGAYSEFRGQEIFNRRMDKRLLNEAIEVMDKLDVYYALENQDICYTKAGYNQVFEDSISIFGIERNKFVTISGDDDIRANKMFVSFKSSEQLEELKEIFKEKLSIAKHRTGNSADVDLFGMSKAIGAGAMIDAMGIDADNVYAFGDGVNDYQLLKIVGHGIAMQKHAPELDEVASFVTESVKNEGIVKGLERLGLI